MTPAEKAEALFRLARSTTSPEERESAVRNAREIVAKHGLHVLPNGRVLERAPEPTHKPATTTATVAAAWDRYAPRAKRFLEAMVASSEAEREGTDSASPSTRRPTFVWDLRDAPERAKRAKR